MLERFTLHIDFANDEAYLQEIGRDMVNKTMGEFK